MSAFTRSLVISRDGRAVVIPTAVALLVGLIVWSFFFRQEIVAAVQVWVASTAFSHCFVVLPLAVYLAWDRRHLARQYALRPVPVAALAGVPLGTVWFVAERIGLMEGRQLVAICFVELLFLAVLGWRLWAAFSAALLYLFFLVPFGAFIVPTLQAVTTHFITAGLDVLGIPYFSDAFTIEISAGTFIVAEACAGLRFLIAAVAFGVLYACLLYRSSGRRIVFVLASAVIPIVANGVRGLGIVVLGHLIGSAQAAAVDHIVYGWLFFSTVLLLMILSGLSFREDKIEDKVVVAAHVEADFAMGVPLVAASAVIALMSIGPMAAFLFNARAADGHWRILLPELTASTRCVAQSVPITGDRALNPAHPITWHFSCEGVPLVATFAAFPPRTSSSFLIAMSRRAAAEGDPEATEASTLTLDPNSPDRWLLVTTTNPLRLTASSLWINGRPVLNSLEGKISQGWNSVFGADYVPIIMTVTLQPNDVGFAPARRAEMQRLLTDFLMAQNALGTQIFRLSSDALRS